MGNGESGIGNRRGDRVGSSVFALTNG